jgi:mobilization protein NikA
MPMITFEATVDEKALIEKAAKKSDMSISDFVRSCVYFDLITSGDLQALRLISRRMREGKAKFFERLREPGLRRLVRD